MPRVAPFAFKEMHDALALFLIATVCLAWSQADSKRYVNRISALEKENAELRKNAKDHGLHVWHSMLFDSRFSGCDRTEYVTK